MTCRHVMGPFQPGTNRRTCLFCEETFPADGTYEIRVHEGTLERYPRSLIARRDYGQIRRFLGLSRSDILLHNWHDEGALYVLRRRQTQARNLPGASCDSDHSTCGESRLLTARCV